MKERFVLRFPGSLTRFPEDDLERFLEANPKYRIACMTHANEGALYHGIIAYFELKEKGDL